MHLRLGTRLALLSGLLSALSACGGASSTTIAGSESGGGGGAAGDSGSGGEASGAGGDESDGSGGNGSGGNGSGGNGSGGNGSGGNGAGGNGSGGQSSGGNGSGGQSSGGNGSGGQSSGGNGSGGQSSGGNGSGGQGSGGTGGSAPSCGNGQVEAGEECDDGNAINVDLCTDTCDAAACGDGYLQPGEECDDGNAINTDACTNACDEGSLNIALESKGSCTDGRQAVFLRIEELLEERGHTVTLVDGTALDTAPEILSYDVIFLGGYTANCVNGEHDLALFDGLINGYLAAGGGLITTGWTLYDVYPIGAPNIVAALPQYAGGAASYLNGPGTVAPAGPHPILDGVTAFTAPSFLPYGNGPKPGATALLTSGATTVGSAWSVQTNGRAVFLGPLFAENLDQYSVASLLDGSTPSAIELLMRSVEWAGGQID